MDIKNNTEWPRNVIIADAEYVDSVAFNLIVNFERMIARHIPQADMAQWVECIALDGGVPVGNEKEDTLVVLVHDKTNDAMNNFNPGIYGEEKVSEDTMANQILNGQAFKGETGEFCFVTVATDNGSERFDKKTVMLDILKETGVAADVARIMFIGNMDDGSYMTSVMPVLRELDRNNSDKRITMFAMQPLTGVPCRQEILGYSLMAALGIKASEIR